MVSKKQLKFLNIIPFYLKARIHKTLQDITNLICKPDVQTECAPEYNEPINTRHSNHSHYSSLLFTLWQCPVTAQKHGEKMWKAFLTTRFFPHASFPIQLGQKLVYILPASILCAYVHIQSCMLASSEQKGDYIVYFTSKMFLVFF